LFFVVVVVSHYCVLDWRSGVLLALRNSAKFYRDGKVAEIDGPELMKSAKPIPTGYPAFAFVGYPNRDSTPYRERYQIPEARTIIRGTLRYDGFPQFVQALVNLGLLSDEQLDFLQPSQEHQSITWRQVICRLVDCDPQTVSADQLLSKVVEKAAPQPEDRQQIIFGLKWLGLLSEEEPLYRRGTLLDTLCATLEEKMKYGSGERDMVMLQHRFLVQLASGQIQTRLSTLLDFGVPHGTTSMAKTVGVPCGLATQLILDGKLAERGVIAPMSMSICQPLLEALEAEGIRMTEEIIE
jgi:saccharopine dehydrogenase-like NADP-dependent oxidoreductase